MRVVAFPDLIGAGRHAPTNADSHSKFRIKFEMQQCPLLNANLWRDIAEKEKIKVFFNNDEDELYL
jgi:hypothetical protein